MLLFLSECFPKSSFRISSTSAYVLTISNWFNNVARRNRTPDFVSGRIPVTSLFVENDPWVSGKHKINPETVVSQSFLRPVCFTGILEILMDLNYTRTRHGSHSSIDVSIFWRVDCRFWSNTIIVSAYFPLKCSARTEARVWQPTRKCLIFILANISLTLCSQ